MHFASEEEQGEKMKGWEGRDLFILQSADSRGRTDRHLLACCTPSACVCVPVCAGMCVFGTVSDCVSRVCVIRVLSNSVHVSVSFKWNVRACVNLQVCVCAYEVPWCHGDNEDIGSSQVKVTSTQIMTSFDGYLLFIFTNSHLSSRLYLMLWAQIVLLSWMGHLRKQCSDLVVINMFQSNST